MKSHQLIKSVRTTIILNQRFLDSFWISSVLQYFELIQYMNEVGVERCIKSMVSENILIVWKVKSNISNY